MSGIFGIFNFHNPSISPKRLKLFSEALAHRGPDGCNTWKEKFIGLGHCMLHTTTESLTEHLPYLDQESGLTITADARLDNRDDLADALGISSSHLKEMADSQLILAAYKKWGTASFIKLLGDFSFALWDSRNQRLICVRDAIGIKPFYYKKTEGGFFCSSEIKPLAQLETTLPPVNEGMVAEYLAFQFATKDETLFQDIFRLPPAHYLIVEREKLTIHRYWDLTDNKPVFYNKESEYGEHFLDLFTHSVACRMRSHQPISAELSGGLDSSSIVSIACSINQKSFLQKIRPFSLVFPGLACDESPYIESVVDKWNIASTLVPGHQIHTPDWNEQVIESYQLPDMPNISFTDKFVATINGTGSKVILSGIGGDEWFTGSELNYMDIFTDKSLSSLFKELQHQKSWYGHKILLKKLLSLLVWPALPISVKSSLCKRSAHKSLPKWIPSSFMAKTDLINRITQTDSRIHTNNLTIARYYHNILSDSLGFFLDTLDRHRARAGIENRYSFLDRRLIEFSARLPENQKYSGGLSKRIVRQGLRNIIPKKVMDRQDKAEFSYFFGQTFLMPEFEKNIKKLMPHKYEWVEGDIYSAAIQETKEVLRKSPENSISNVWPLWFAFATLLWYKKLYL